MRKIKNENEIAIEISRMFKHMFGRGPEMVMFDVCRDLIIVRINRLLSKGQRLLVDKRPDSLIVEQYYRSIVDEVLLPEIGRILSQFVDVDFKYLTDKVDIKENFIVIIFKEVERGRM